MENLFYNISQVLGITIIHSLWQGLLVWFVLHLLFTCAPSMSSVKKHNLGMTGIFTICTWFIYTFAVQIQQHVWVDLAAVTSPGLLPHFDFPLNAATHAIPAARLNYIIEGYLPYVSALYFAGLVFNLLRMGLNLQKLSLIKNTMIPADEVQIYVDNLCKKLCIHKYVSVNFSRMVDVPCMIGYFKPIILLPITLTTYLTATEIEAILLHELSHIKRNDYLLNMIQQLITVLLFFNPFAQLINKLINQERENRCDDLVVQTTAQPLIYAQALLKLEQTRHTDLRLALAATSKKYPLLTRIERIMKTTKPMGNIRHLLVAVAIMAASISSIAWLNPTIKNGKLSIKKLAFPKVIAEPIDTIRKSAVKSKKVVAYKKAKENQANHEKHMAERYGLNDAELNRLTAEVTKHAEAMSKYYNSADFKRQSELLQQKGQAMADYYNRPEMKQLQERQQKIAAEYQKEVGDGSETKELSEKMRQAGEKMGAYFKSQEFKQMNEQLEKKYGIPHNHNYIDDSKDENYRKYQDELQSKIPAEIKQQTDEMKKMGEQMRAKYDSPEFRKKQAELRMMGDSMRKAYSNPQMKEQQAEMRKLGEQMRSYQNNPELKKEKELLEQASKRLHEYTNSPAFKKKMEEYRKQAYNYQYDYKYDNKYDSDAKADTTNR
ncbi:M56 family metallopeptidase [Mucilaginibacter sp. SG564]|uniref:M56 family metallopeptidase n=1 Tax=unclassified Mucilaginibacter TaxID=2617802 RepID=UPI00155250B9|nr:M56 family metallopeptidase [Mucilaginibacter sp. SG564]NOW98128.1 beta-lactamase regulating signal transducer with metallopeptidase domain [Mucilaginibacter sp. SG564]